MDRTLTEKIKRELSVSVEEAGRAIGVSRNVAYRGVKSGEIPSIKVGGRLVVPTGPLRRLLGIEGEAA